MTVDFDIAIVGAGAVGLACAYFLSRGGASVVVLEAERAIGQGVSSRNSEVVHGGLYYPTGSLRARLCVRGRRLLYDFLDAHKIAYNRCGKLVVATAPEHLPKLEAIYTQARTNGVEGMKVLSDGQARELEPELSCLGALLSPESGVFDSHGYMLALQGEIEAAGGSVVVATPFAGARPLAGGGLSVSAGGADPAEFTCRHVVIAAGLSAQDAALRIETFSPAAVPPRFLGKGCYFRLQGKAPFRHLVYPPPIPGALGTHYRRDLGGQAVFGPDLEFIDKPDYTVDPDKREAFAAAVRPYWPGVTAAALVPDYAGIRPKLHGPGVPQPDFRIDGPAQHGTANVVALFGIESPGLTASLAIGEHVSDLIRAMG